MVLKTLIGVCNLYVYFKIHFIQRPVWLSKSKLIGKLQLDKPKNCVPPLLISTHFSWHPNVTV